MQNLLFASLNAAGIPQESFAGAQILCLPENILRFADGEELLETTDTDSFAKLLRQAGLTVFTFMDAGIDLSAVDRRSGDKWLGTVWIRDIVVIPTLIAVLSGYLMLQYDRSTKREEPMAAKIVHVDFVLDRGKGEHEHVKFKGDGETLIKFLEKIHGAEPSKN